MSVSNYWELKAHLGHDIEIVKYGDENVAIECIDCNEVLVDFDREPEDEGEPVAKPKNRRKK